MAACIAWGLRYDHHGFIVASSLNVWASCSGKPLRGLGALVGLYSDLQSLFGSKAPSPLASSAAGALWGAQGSSPAAPQSAPKHAPYVRNCRRGLAPYVRNCRRGLAPYVRNFRRGLAPYVRNFRIFITLSGA